MTTTAAPHRTWTFTPPDSANLGPVTTTCPVFCRTDHTPDMAHRIHPEDIWCQQFGPSVRTPLSSTDDKYLQCRVLEAQLTMRPFVANLAEQVPHVTVEFDEGVWTPPMNPDQFAEFINRLALHVDSLRIMHGQLVTALAEHQAGAL